MKYLSLLLALLVSHSAFAEMSKDEMMKAFGEYSTPGAAHKKLKDMSGNWKFTSKMWESKDAKPEESKGTAKMKMIMGGRYLQQEFKGKAMGMPFEGLGFIGFNNATQKYETSWLDNFGTGMMHNNEAAFDESGNVLKEEGEHTCPLSSDKKRDYRSEWKLVDKNNMVYTMYGEGPTGGPEFKQMEITYVRAK